MVVAHGHPEGQVAVVSRQHLRGGAGVGVQVGQVGKNPCRRSIRLEGAESRGVAARRAELVSRGVGVVLFPAVAQVVAVGIGAGCRQPEGRADRDVHIFRAGDRHFRGIVGGGDHAAAGAATALPHEILDLDDVAQVIVRVVVVLHVVAAGAGAGIRHDGAPAARLESGARCNLGFVARAVRPAVPARKLVTKLMRRYQEKIFGVGRLGRGGAAGFVVVVASPAADHAHLVAGGVARKDMRQVVAAVGNNSIDGSGVLVHPVAHGVARVGVGVRIEKNDGVVVGNELQAQAEVALLNGNDEVERRVDGGQHQRFGAAVKHRVLAFGCNSDAVGFQRHQGIAAVGCRFGRARNFLQQIAMLFYSAADTVGQFGFAGQIGQAVGHVVGFLAHSIGPHRLQGAVFIENKGVKTLVARAQAHRRA